MQTEPVESEPDVPITDDTPIFDGDVPESETLQPEHVAFCPECPAGVKYRLTASGHSHIWLERYGVDLETAFGAAENGIPLCPNGHGEMKLRDETLPASEAITQVAEQINGGEARQMRLPGTVMPFNDAGALEHIFEKRHSVKVLEDKYTDLKERTAKAKKAFDEENAELGAMIDDYEEKRQHRQDEIERAERQAAEGHPEGTNLVRCEWERKNPGEVCPICSTALDPTAVKLPSAPESEAHAVEVRDYLIDLKHAAFREGLIIKGAVFEIATIAEWTTEQLAEVGSWDGDKEKLPAAFGRPHVLDEAPGFDVIDDVRSDYALCIECGARLFDFDGKEDLPYPPGTLIGTDCTGQPARTLPKRGTKKQATRGDVAKAKREASEEPKPKKAAKGKGKK